MTTKQLAHDLYLGLRDAFHCPDVSITEYEGAMAYRIDKAIDAATQEAFMAGFEYGGRTDLTRSDYEREQANACFAQWKEGRRD
jgi:hypothetical protein